MHLSASPFLYLLTSTPTLYSQAAAGQQRTDTAGASRGAEPVAESMGGGPGGIDFPAFGAVPVSPRALFKLLKRGEPTLLYPGGVREAFKSTKKGEGYKLFWYENSYRNRDEPNPNHQR